MELKQGYKQTEVGLIPEDWELKKFTDCATLKHGFQFREEHFSSDGIKVVKIGTLKYSGELDFNNVTYVPNSDLKKFSNFLLSNGDILMALTGATLGKCSIVKTNETLLQNYRVGNFYNKSICTKGYIYVILKSDFIQKTFKKLVNEAAQPNIGKGDFDKFIIPIPSLPEQTAIANALSDMDALISQTEKLIEKKKAIKQGAMQELLKPKEGWLTKKLGDVAKFFKGSGLPKADLTEAGKYRCIHYGELFTIYKENIDNIKSRTNKNLGAFLSSANDVLMPTSDVTPNGLATASCINENNIVLGGDILVIRSDSNKIDGVFLSYSIKFNRQQIMKLVSGSTVYHLYGSDMSKFIFSFPDIKIQQEISRLLIDMEDEINKYQTKLTKLKQQKQGMMQALLTGKIRLVS